MHTPEVHHRERRVLFQCTSQRLGPLIADRPACTPKRANKERDAHRPMSGTGLDSPLPIHLLLAINRGAHGGRDAFTALIGNTHRVWLIVLADSAGGQRFCRHLNSQLFVQKIFTSSHNPRPSIPLEPFSFQVANEAFSTSGDEGCKEGHGSFHGGRRRVLRREMVSKTVGNQGIVPCR